MSLNQVCLCLFLCVPSKHEQYHSYLSKIGKRISHERKKQNISQAQLAFEIHSTTRQIQRIEKGEINAGLTYYIAISEALNVSLSELLNL